MSSVSIKGVLLGAIIGFVVVGFLTFALMAIIANVTNSETGLEMTRVVQTSWTVFAMIQLIGIAGPIFTGYLAARIAKRGELLNSTLSSFLIVGSGLFALVEYPATNMLNAVVATVCAPLLCLLGGYLRLRQIRRNAEVTTAL